MSPGPSHRAEQKDRLAVLKNEQQVSNLRPGDSEPATLHSLANLDTGLEGRFSKADYVSGQDESVFYPRLPANSPWGDGPNPGLEPPTGVAIDAQLPCGEPFEVARSLAELSATALMAAEAGKAEVAAPTLVDHPTANVVERTSATSLISSASASPAGDGDEVGHNHSIVRTSSPTLHRPTRRL